MSRIKNLPQAAKLETYRVALSNAKTNEEYSSYLKEVGISEENLEEGNTLYEKARVAYDIALRAKDNQYEMGKAFSEKVSVLDEKFKVDWKKASIVFKYDLVVREKLSLKKPYYKTYVKWIEQARKFYTELSTNSDIAERLSRYNYNNDNTNAGLAAILEIEVARAKYINEKGISQNATKTKHKAFNALNEWMDIFYSLAKIAFNHQPQLMESFGLVVKD